MFLSEVVLTLINPLISSRSSQRGSKGILLRKSDGCKHPAGFIFHVKLSIVKASGGCTQSVMCICSFLQGRFNGAVAQGRAHAPHIIPGIGESASPTPHSAPLIMKPRVCIAFCSDALHEHSTQTNARHPSVHISSLFADVLVKISAAQQRLHDFLSPSTVCWTVHRNISITSSWISI